MQMRRTGWPPLLVGSALEALVRATAGNVRSPIVTSVVEKLCAELGSNLLGVLFYGSHLNSTAGRGSDHDFFVIVESYRKAHRGRLHVLLNRFLPPSIYHRSIPMPEGAEASCKLCFVSARDLVRGTVPAAPDCYLFGRLGKRVALVHARDEGARRMIEESVGRSIALSGAWALRGMEGPFTPGDFLLASLALSYRAEERVEGEARAKRLFSADEEHYRKVYGAVLEEARRRGLVEPAGAAGLLETAGESVHGRASRRAYLSFLRRSRLRARLRWLKNIWTFEGWADYMIAKIERHQGISIELEPWERRHLFLAAVKHYFRLRREGRLR